MKILWLLLSIVTAMITLVPQAFADLSASVKPIQVSGLENYQGQFITAIYANGGTGLLFSSNLILRKIKVQKTLPIRGQTVTFPSVIIPALPGLESPYNYVILVIHPDDRPNASFKWVNSNGAQLQGTEIGNNTDITRFNSLSEKKIKDLSKMTENETSIHYQFD